MEDEVKFYLDLAKNDMQETLKRLEVNLTKVRVGKANPQMLRNISIDYYGVNTPLVQASNISTPDAQTLTIQPFDKNLISAIEQAIIESNLGFNPSNNGEKVIIHVPPLTEDRRRDLVKQAKSETENAKVQVRNVRQKANDEMKKLGKNGLSEDLQRDAEIRVQEITNSYTGKIDDMFAVKEKDIMKV